jgi:hypothetical protein
LDRAGFGAVVTGIYYGGTIKSEVRTGHLKMGNAGMANPKAA